MISTQSIASALDSIDFKKQNLRKAYDDLQAHSYFLSSFTLQWKDLEEHFESIQKSIEQRFSELKLQEKGKAKEVDNEKEEEKEQESPPKNSDDDEDVAVVRRELKSFCSKMNGMGLLSYVTSHLRLVQDELGDALKSAPDPAKLVLDAMLGFYPSDSVSEEDLELADRRRACILLLEKLNDLSALLDFPVSEKAFNLAVEWKGRIDMERKDSLEALAFLHLSATYGLSSAFKADELIDIVATVSGRKEAPDFCRWLGLTDKLQDLIQKLRGKGLHLDAIEFLYAFDAVKKYPPVHILKGYLKYSRKLALETRTNGKNSYESQLEATSIELAAVRAIIKCVVEHKLESEYPLENLEKLTELLEKQKPSKKRLKNVAVQQNQTADDKRTTPAPSNEVPVVETSATNGPDKADIQKSGDTRSRSTSPHSQSQSHGPYRPPNLRSTCALSQSPTHGPQRPPNLLPDQESPKLDSSAQYGGVPGSKHVSQPQSHPMGFPRTPAHNGSNLGSQTQAHCRPMGPLPGVAPQYMSSSAPYGSMPSPGHGVPQYMNPAYLGSPAQYGSNPGSKPFTPAPAQLQYHPQGPLPNPASPYMISSGPYGSAPHANHSAPPQSSPASYGSVPNGNHSAPSLAPYGSQPLPNHGAHPLNSSGPYGSAPHSNHGGPPLSSSVPYASAPHSNHGAPPPRYMSPYAGGMVPSPVNYALQQQPPTRPNFY